MTDSQPVIATLSNGLRAVCLTTGGGVDYFGVAVNAGSRDEGPGEHGLAHFVEHTIFKGTRRRRPWHILNRMERVGGELNAFTTKEETVVYTVAPAGCLDRAVELVADIVTDSTFAMAELERERHVVEDEIMSYLDTPSESVYDSFDERLFAGSPLAHNILGNEESLAAFTTADCRRWLEERFTLATMVLFYCGPLAPGAALRVLERRFGPFGRQGEAPVRETPRLNPPFTEAISRDFTQCHAVWGLRTGGMFDSATPAMRLAANMLGGPGMNSLLNVEMRERRGLVYTVEASTVHYTDCGEFTVYYGCDKSEATRCREVMLRTIGRMAADGIMPRRLDEARRQYVGQLTVSAENRENLALGAARSLLFRGEVHTLESRIKSVMAITAAEMKETLAMLHPDNFSICTLS